MDFLKKNYEKILLGLVLVGLVGALVCLPVVIQHDRAAMDSMSTTIVHSKTKPMPAVDLSQQQRIMERMETPYPLDLETGNKVFNPVQWQIAADGHLIKISNDSVIGGDAVTVAQITPLYLVLTLDSVTTNELGARYTIGIERQAAATPALRRKTSRYVSSGDPKNDVFKLSEVKGSAENPTQLVFQLTDSGEMAPISKDAPFRRVDGYSADLKYTPEGKTWAVQRKNAALKFANDDYIIVDISKNEVVLLQKSNLKKFTRPYNP